MVNDLCKANTHHNFNRLPYVNVSVQFGFNPFAQITKPTKWEIKKTFGDMDFCNILWADKANKNHRVEKQRNKIERRYIWPGHTHNHATLAYHIMSMVLFQKHLLFKRISQTRFQLNSYIANLSIQRTQRAAKLHILFFQSFEQQQAALLTLFLYLK